MIHEFETEKAYLCAVKVPYDAENFDIINDSDECGSWSMLEFELENKDEESGFYGNFETHDIAIPTTRDWQLLGEASKISEEQADLVVDSVTVGKVNQDIYYLNYKGDNFVCKTALLSFSTKLESERIYTVNPLGEKPNKYKLLKDKTRILPIYNYGPHEFLYEKFYSPATSFCFWDRNKNDSNSYIFKYNGKFQTALMNFNNWLKTSNYSHEFKWQEAQERTGRWIILYCPKVK